MHERLSKELAIGAETRRSGCWRRALAPLARLYACAAWRSASVRGVPLSPPDGCWRNATLTRRRNAWFAEGVARSKPAYSREFRRRATTFRQPSCPAAATLKTGARVLYSLRGRGPKSHALGGRDAPGNAANSCGSKGPIMPLLQGDRRQTWSVTQCRRNPAERYRRCDLGFYDEWHLGRNPSA